MTLYGKLKDDWEITNKQLADLGINYMKLWEETTVSDLEKIADYLDINVSDLF